jgi:iron-sulfur cluster repair protein YtfE (RIC family)
MNTSKPEIINDAANAASVSVPPVHVAAPSEGNQNVDKIRDIIFGGQMREYDVRFAAVENRLIKESTRLRQDMEERMDSLENLVLREFETLNNKLQLEKKERNESLLSAESLLKKAHDLLSQRLGDLENKNLEEIRKLRNQEHEDIKNLRSNLHELREELSSHIDREIDALRKSKVDKAGIAALFAGGNS